MDIIDIDKRIYSCNEAICKNIESLQANERGLLSQNILSQLRNFLECVFLKIYAASGNSKAFSIQIMISWSTNNILYTNDFHESFYKFIIERIINIRRISCLY